VAVAEYCGNCDKRTLRKVGPCPECTPKNVESQTTDTQQLKAEISALATKLIESDKAQMLYEDVYLVINELQKLSAV